MLVRRVEFLFLSTTAQSVIYTTVTKDSSTALSAVSAALVIASTVIPAIVAS